MADIDGAIGYVVAHGDPVDRARLSYLRSGAAPPPDAVAKAEMGQAPGGGWPSYLVAGWLGAALLYHAGWFYEAAQIQVILADRVPDMTPAEVAWLAAAMRRVGLGSDDWLLTAARKRLTETQRSDGGWPSDDGPAFDVHTTLTAIRALR